MGSQCRRPDSGRGGFSRTKFIIAPVALGPAVLHANRRLGALAMRLLMDGDRPQFRRQSDR